MLPYTISQNSITVLINGIPKVVDSSHPNYAPLLDAIKRHASDREIEELIDIATAVVNYSGGDIEVLDGVVLFKGKELHNYAVDKLFELMNEGFNINPLVNFLGNLMENPSYRAVQELYKFLEVGGIPITEDGHFVVYKKVQSNYKDIHSGTFDNSVGATCEMPRNEVNEDSNQTCSAGLHVCSYTYLAHFGSASGNRVVACKVNPKDVVSIPNDYNHSKMRVCRYEVIEDVTEKSRQGDVLREVKVYQEPTKVHDELSKDKTGKPVMMVLNQKGKKVNVAYASAKQAEKSTGIFATNITKACKGIRPKAGGCTWKYL